jgi:hypothetical protein
VQRHIQVLVAAAGACALPAATASADEAAPLPTTSAAEPAGEFEPGFELSAGLDYSSGTYGGVQETTMFYAPVTARVRGERWRVDVTAPFLEIEGPANVFGAPGGPIVVEPDGTAPIETRSGLGDVIVGGTFSLGGGGDLPWVDVTVKTKLPTAADGLGTGELDYSAQVDLYQVVNEQLTLMGSIGYQVLGDPDEFELEDGVLAMVGLNVKPSTKTDLGFLIDYRQTAVEGFDDQIAAVPYACWRMSEHLGLTAYGTAGLTDMSPDFSVGFQLTFYR